MISTSFKLSKQRAINYSALLVLTGVAAFVTQPDIKSVAPLTVGGSQEISAQSPSTSEETLETPNTQPESTPTPVAETPSSTPQSPGNTPQAPASDTPAETAPEPEPVVEEPPAPQRNNVSLPTCHNGVKTVTCP